MQAAKKVLHNHRRANFPNIEGEAIDRKYKQLNLGDGQAHDHSSG
jgi:hypothetical protein